MDLLTFSSFEILGIEIPSLISLIIFSLISYLRFYHLNTFVPGSNPRYRIHNVYIFFHVIIFMKGKGYFYGFEDFTFPNNEIFGKYGGKEVRITYCLDTKPITIQDEEGNKLEGIARGFILDKLIF